MTLMNVGLLQTFNFSPRVLTFDTQVIARSHHNSDDDHDDDRDEDEEEEEEEEVDENNHRR